MESSGSTEEDLWRLFKLALDAAVGVSFLVWLGGGTKHLIAQLCPQRVAVAQCRSPMQLSNEPIAESSQVPSLNIVMLIAGTHGDVAPFVALGLQLQRQYGHRVRVASHMAHQDYVRAQGLDFYPLSGDPRMLSSWMVQSEGRLLPNLRQGLKDLHLEMTKTIPDKLAMINSIMESCWPACADPMSEVAMPHQRFVAHAIISNPPANGHIHCASALNIPLHMAFPMPWSPTAETPHPMMRSSAKKRPSGHALDARAVPKIKTANDLTYYVFDELMWMSLNVNSWREQALNLPRLNLADRGAHVLKDLRVPFAYLYSPSLSPKPKDWGAHIDVVGSLLLGAENVAHEPDEQLAAFLDKGTRPIFVGFGSMVIDDPEHLFAMIVEAANQTQQRVIIQSSWSQLGSAAPTPPCVHLLGSCPHAWLFRQCSAVIHHGGAGTVAAGLGLGLPTFVVPFFGDQHFWGSVVFRAGVGPEPCPYRDLSVERLVNGIRVLADPTVREQAQDMALKMAQEDGIQSMIASFHRHLPVADMLCMVSLFAKSEPQVVVAEKYQPFRGLRTSAEVHAVLQASSSRTSFFQDYAYIFWDAAGPVFYGHSFLAIAASVLQLVAYKIYEFFAEIVMPFTQTRALIRSWQIKGGYRGPAHLGMAVLITLLGSLVEMPFKLILWQARLVWQLLEFTWQSIIYGLAACSCSPSSRLLQLPAPHPGIRPLVDISTVTPDRRQDLLCAAAVAEHVFAIISSVQRRRRGEFHPQLSYIEAVHVLDSLSVHESSLKQLIGGDIIKNFESQSWPCCLWATRIVSRIYPSHAEAKELLHSWKVHEAISVVDFCCLYRQHLTNHIML